MVLRVVKLLFCVAFVAHLAACRSEHFATDDQWWLSILDQPHRRGHHHYCVVDKEPNRPVQRGEASYCTTNYPDGITVYRRDAKATLVQGWRTWIINTDHPERWMSLRDSVFGAVTRIVGDIPKCRDAVPEGLMRITSWHLDELAVITHEPAWGGLPAYEISIALGRPTGRLWGSPEGGCLTRACSRGRGRSKET
jgi:hypothetical protein